jgi:hypothetical protein
MSCALRFMRNVPEQRCTREVCWKDKNSLLNNFEKTTTRKPRPLIRPRAKAGKRKMHTLLRNARQNTHTHTCEVK